MSTDVDPAVAYINDALEELQRLAGRKLAPSEAQQLGEFAHATRAADGWPDIQAMADAFSLSQAINDYAIPLEDRTAFAEQILASQGEDDEFDMDAAITEFYGDPGEPEPQPELAPDATATERRAWLAERAGALDREQQEDREHRSARRKEALDSWNDPGPADPDMRAWEADGRPPDLDDKQERIEFMAERLEALNAEPDA
jgi:hypothetical protein